MAKIGTMDIKVKKVSAEARSKTLSSVKPLKAKRITLRDMSNLDFIGE